MKSLTLSNAGKTDYLIVLPNEPQPVETHAANELKKYLDEITGSNFNIIKESEVIDKRAPLLVVGNSSLAKTLLPEVDAARLPYDGIVVETVGKNVVMLGHLDRGTLYAVYTFLEEVIGVRWWTSTESYIPKVKKLKIPEVQIHHAPQLIYRDSYYKDPRSSADFTAQMKLNGSTRVKHPKYGGGHSMMYGVHSFYIILPPDKYFNEHPEWYSLIDGKRVNERAQLCLSNEEMREEFTRNVLKDLRANPDTRFVDISQNDYNGACECDACQAIVKEEGSESGPLIRFVNAIAKEVEKEFPNTLVETLAYNYTRKAPLHVVPRDNVLIRLCTIECSFSEPLAHGEQNKPLRDDMKEWNEITEHLFIWDYVTCFTSYMLPHPNLHVLAPNIRFFIDNKTIGLFEQGDNHCDAGDFVRMRNWIISHLMWNPNLDENKLIDEFLTGYYGANAAPHLRQYWDLLTKAAKESNVYLSCYMFDTADWLTAPVCAQAASLMKKAIEVTSDETLRNRLRREEIPIKFVQLLENKRFKEYERENTGIQASVDNPEQALAEFMSLLKEFNVTKIREGYLPDHIQYIEDLLRKSLSLE